MLVEWQWDPEEFAADVQAASKAAFGDEGEEAAITINEEVVKSLLVAESGWS